MTTFVPAQCFACTRLHRDNSTVAGLQMVVSCDAYPGQVPDDIRTFGDDHRQARGDEFGGLLFDPDPERAETFNEWATFAGVTETMPLTAAAPPASGAPHTGAMIALIPTVDDMEALAVPGGEPADQLHCTVLFLGEADMWTGQERAGIVDVCRQVAAVSEPVEADGFALSLFNPAGAEPCVVMGLSGTELANLHDAVTADVDPGVDQHQPWIPHVTLAYSDDLRMLGECRDRCGPVVFDRLRVAFGDEITDLPLGEPEPDDQQEPVTAAVRIAWSGCPRCFDAEHDGPCQPQALRSPSTGWG